MLLSIALGQELVAQPIVEVVMGSCDEPGGVLDRYTLSLNGTELQDGTCEYPIDINDVIPGVNEIVIGNTEGTGGILNGVSTLDLVLIFGSLIVDFDSPFNVIAADFDADGVISTKDIIEMRRYILGIETEALYPNYRMVDANLIFPSDFGPFNIGSDFTSIQFLNTEVNDGPFEVIIIKSGDVNGSALLNSEDVPVSRSTATLSYLDIPVKAGEVYEIEMDLDANETFQASSFGLLFDGMNVLSVDENGHDLLYNNTTSTLKLSHFTDHPESTFNFTVEVEALVDGKVSDMMTLDTDFYKEVVDIEGNVGDVSLSANVVSSSLDIVETLFTISPNPVTEFLNLSFENNGSATQKNIELISLDGKSISRFQTKADAFQIDVTSIQSKGLHLVRVTQDGKTKVEKVFIQ